MKLLIRRVHSYPNHHCLHITLYQNHLRNSLEKCGGALSWHSGRAHPYCWDYLAGSSYARHWPRLEGDNLRLVYCESSLRYGRTKCGLCGLEEEYVASAKEDVGATLQFF